jgi:hypothetical protein
MLRNSSTCYHAGLLRARSKAVENESSVIVRALISSHLKEANIALPIIREKASPQTGKWKSGDISSSPATRSLRARVSSLVLLNGLY